MKARSLGWIGATIVATGLAGCLPEPDEKPDSAAADATGDAGMVTPARDAASTADDAGSPRDEGTNEPSSDAAVDDSGSTAPPPPPAETLAFPGAEGFGAHASGGRGGRVVYVTNLDRSGPGSLQAALDMTGPRYVLFKVSGVIDGPAHVRNGDVTIAGQTSPGGVIIRGMHTEEEPWCGENCPTDVVGIENVILRHVRSRPMGSWDDGIKLRYARNLILDHVSVGAATDEEIQISYTHDLTIQNTILAETIGDHAVRGGILINYTDPAAGYALDRISLHHNMWNRIGGRFPELSRESGADAAGTTMQIEVSNNLFWDQQYYADVNPTTISGGSAGEPIYYQLNWVNNLSWVRETYPRAMLNFPNPTGRSSTYLAGNEMNLYPARRDYELMYCCRDYASVPIPARPSWARSERHPFAAITYTPTENVRAYMLDHVGAFPRDPMDRRLLASVRAGTVDPTPVDRNPANDALATDFTAANAPAAPIDSDDDGMPDTWETAHGLDPHAQDHNGTQLSQSMTGATGYTNLECYLDELAKQREASGS